MTEKIRKIIKVLPKKQDIDREKNLERKKEIDSGVALATRIDKLRETKANEEKMLREWRDTSIRLVQVEIDDYLTVKENLRKQTEEAEVYRKKLIEPLDIEWEQLNEEKAKLIKEKESLTIGQELLLEDERKIEQDQEKLSKIISKSKKDEEDTEKAKNESVALKEMAQREFEKIKEEHEIQTELHEKELYRVHQLQKEYEVGIVTNEIKEKQLEEKEAELITREHELARRTKNLEMVERIKNNAPINKSS